MIVNCVVLIDMFSARAVAGSAGMITCMPIVPQAVSATNSKNGAVRARREGA